MKKNLIAVAVAAMFVGTVGVANAAGGIPGLGDSNINNNANTNTNVNTATSGAAANAAAGAVGFGGAGGQGGQGGAADVDLRNTNTNSAFGGAGGSVLGSGNAAQHQGQHQGQGQGQDQGQSQSANNNGNAQNTTINQNYNAPKQYRNAPSMNAYMGTPGINCASVYSLAVSGPGLGIGGGFSGESDTCNRREAARVLTQMGEQDTAMEVMCQDKMISETTRCQDIRRNKANKVASNDSHNAAATVTKTTATVEANHVTLNGNVVEDTMTGKTYGYIRNGEFREVNQVPFAYRDEVSALVASTIN